MHLKIIYILPILLIQSCVFDCKDYLNNEIKPKAFSGQIVEKGIEDIGCFGFIVIKNINGFDTLKRFCFCVPDAENAWNHIEIDDSISKERGTLDLKIIKDGILKRFPYPCCSQ